MLSIAEYVEWGLYVMGKIKTHRKLSIEKVLKIMKYSELKEDELKDIFTICELICISKEDFIKKYMLDEIEVKIINLYYEEIEKQKEENKIKEMLEWKLRALECLYFQGFQECFYKEAHNLITTVGYFPTEFKTKCQNKGIPLHIIKGMEEKMSKKYRRFYYLNNGLNNKENEPETKATIKKISCLQYFKIRKSK